MKSVISNGSYKFHLAPLAAELDRRGLLLGFITAGWPSGWMRWLAERFPHSPAWRRLIARREAIAAARVSSFGEVEILFKIGDILLRRFSPALTQRVHRIAFQWYGWRAESVMRRLRPPVYHYRNCYGLNSVAIARSVGAIPLCDHSIAHPLCLYTMERHLGRYPTSEEMVSNIQKMPPLYRAMNDDLERADYILVNSDFVKNTCVYAGLNACRIYVIYLGVDDQFFASIPEFDENQILLRQANSLLFAGGWQRRKGVETFTTALEQVKAEWELQVIAGIEPELRRLPATSEFFSRRNVTHVGVIPRPELAAAMIKSRIFVFPSFCEGSARVIFEAMACGCYIITTPNAGSIVEDGLHGAVVPPGDAHALTEAINWALANPVRVSKIGWQNAELVRSNYRQSDYADRVLDVYESILTSNRIQNQ